MTKTEYFKIIETWKRLYGAPAEGGPYRYRPLEADACCRKCGKLPQHMSRHHKANDFFFALWRPDLYAARYIEFHPDDCVKLCNRCHANAERYYKQLKEELYASFNIYKYNGLTLTPEWCENWKTKFRAMFEKWLNRPHKRRKKKRRLTAKRKATKFPESSAIATHLSRHFPLYDL